MNTQDFTKDTKGEIVIYQSEEGKAAIDVILQDETVWVTQEQMVALFGKAKSTISEHLKHIFEEGELDQNSVVRFFRTTAADGKSYNTAYYNLDVVISVGYRVHSVQGTRFRQWATQRIHEYIIKGYTLDDERLKGNGGRYFRELLQRIRDIHKVTNKNLKICILSADFFFFFLKKREIYLHISKKSSNFAAKSCKDYKIWHITSMTNWNGR